MKVRGPFLGAAALGSTAIAILLTVVHLASQSPEVEVVGGHPVAAGEESSFDFAESGYGRAAPRR